MRLTTRTPVIEISYCEHGQNRALCLICAAPPEISKAAIELAERIQDVRDEIVDAAQALEAKANEGAPFPLKGYYEAQARLCERVRALRDLESAARPCSEALESK